MISLSDSACSTEMYADLKYISPFFFYFYFLILTPTPTKKKKQLSYLHFFVQEMWLYIPVQGSLSTRFIRYGSYSVPLTLY